MSGLLATYVDPDTFTVSGDLTDVLVAGRRIKADCGVDGFKYGTIQSSSYGDGNTTVNLTSNSDALTSNLDVFWYGIIGGGASNQSMPLHLHDGSEGSGGELVYGSEFQQASSESESITTSDSFVQKLRLTTSDLPEGTYRIGFYCELYKEDEWDASECKVELNDTTIIANFVNGSGQMGNPTVFVLACSGFYYTTLSGVNTIDIDWRQIHLRLSARIRRARIEVWRIS